jgi:hypothetical protein
MPCLFVAVALIAPRFAIAVLWFFTSWFEGIFSSILWPVLGFIFLPMSLLWYTAVQNWFGGEWGVLQVVGIVIAVLIDLSPASGKRRS